MGRQRRRKRALGLAAAVALALLLASVLEAAPPAAVGEKNAPAAIRSVAEMVGPTDGFSLVIQTSGDLMGSLETCGCPKRPMGGYAWRSGYRAMLASAVGSGVAILDADAGHAFAADVGPAGMPDDVRIKNEWMLRSFAALDVAAVNVAAADLVYLGKVLGAKDYRANLARFPALAKLVSANVTPTGRDRTALRPFVVRTVPASGGARPVRVAFVGVAETAPPSLSDRVAPAVTGYRIGDPVEALTRVLPAARRAADLVVVLAYVDRETASELAALAPAPDVVVAAHQYPLFGKTDAVGPATVAYVSTQTKWLAELRFARPAGARAAKPAVVAHRDVPLDAQTPLDPKADEMVSAARTEFTAVQQEAIARAATGGMAVSLEEQRAALDRSSGFAGSESCARCHSYQYQVWQASGHAHAFRTLEQKNRHLDPACTTCHVVRQGEPGGFVNTRLTPRLQDVQCESCHGPGREHIANPTADYGRAPVPETCVKCHTFENDPDFDFAKYWPKIRHDQGDE